MYTVVLFN